MFVPWGDLDVNVHTNLLAPPLNVVDPQLADVGYVQDAAVAVDHRA